MVRSRTEVQLFSVRYLLPSCIPFGRLALSLKNSPENEKSGFSPHRHATRQHGSSQDDGHERNEKKRRLITQRNCHGGPWHTDNDFFELKTEAIPFIEYFDEEEEEEQYEDDYDSDEE